MIKRKIGWTVFTPNYDESNAIAEQQIKDLYFGESNNQEQLDDNYENENENDKEFIIDNAATLETFLMSSKKIKTPFGFYEVDDQFSPYNMFECWVAYTNFRITKEDFNTLDKNIDGIGCLSVISPYRFFIGIEKFFNFTNVRAQIQKFLCDDFNKISENSSDISDIQSNLWMGLVNNALSKVNNLGNKKWTIFIGNDGNIKTIQRSDFSSEVEYNEEIKKLKNGNIITYDNL